jgi:hypothetical protein
VLPGRLDEPLEPGDTPPLFRTERAVLAAFDDAAVERWRTELNGGPTDLAIADGDLWVSHDDGTVKRLDSSDGRMLGQVTIKHNGRLPSLVGAFGSVWAAPRDSSGRPSRLVRIDPDLSTTDIELDCDDCPTEDPIAGAGAIWFPLGDRGVAKIDSDTNQVTVIPVDDIGHEALRVAVDGDVAYVASENQVTSIVDGEVRATVAPGEIWYLGPIDGVFGVMDPAGQVRILRSADPMVMGIRDVSTAEQTGPVGEIDGEAWIETGRNYDLRRLELLPAR